MAGTDALTALERRTWLDYREAVDAMEFEHDLRLAPS